MTGCKMVENSKLSPSERSADLYATDLAGTSHLAEILTATKGALVVKLSIKDIIFKGVLLEVSNLSLCPSVVTLPKPKSSKDDEKHSIVTVNTNDTEIPEAEISTSACQFRQTYLSEGDQHSYSSVAPSRSITSSIRRLHDNRRLRQRISKPKFFLCSMCKTHCIDSDEHSDRESGANLTTPPIKISFKAPNGHSVMEIEPKKYKKSSHKRKHKSKKHSKRLKDSSNKEPDFGNMEHSSLAKSVMEPSQSPDVAVGPQVMAKLHPAQLQSLADTNDDDSECNDLVIDIPGEPVTKRRRKLTPSTLATNRVLGLDSPPSATSDINADPVLPITKTKARLRRQKNTPKIAKNSTAVSSKPQPTLDKPASVTSEVKSRLVSKYESSSGKRICVGDVIWGKVMGFPWWPGRVCTITVDETVDGMILGHTADIDWYSSPTKSHLSCSLIYPFIEDFSKRFDKKKKSKSYIKAINEAKKDAVLNAQFQDDSDPDEDEANTVGGENLSSIGQTNESIVEAKEDGPCEKSVEESKDSKSLLVDAFLRTSEQAAPSNQMAATCSEANELYEATNNANDGEEADDCLTISLPSPRSLLNSH